MIDDHWAILEAIKVDPWYVWCILRALGWGLALRFPADMFDAGIFSWADLDILLVDETRRSCIFYNHVTPGAIRAQSAFHDESPAGTILTDRSHPLMLCHVFQGESTCSAHQSVPLIFLSPKCIILTLEVVHLLALCLNLAVVQLEKEAYSDYCHKQNGYDYSEASVSGSVLACPALNQGDPFDLLDLDDIIFGLLGDVHLPAEEFEPSQLYLESCRILGLRGITSEIEDQVSVITNVEEQKGVDGFQGNSGARTS